MWSFIGGIATAVVLGMAIELLNGGLSRMLRRLRMKLAEHKRVAYDPTIDGLKMLGEWSPARRLVPNRLQTRVTEPADVAQQPWIDGPTLRHAVDESHESSGDTMYVTNFRLDHRESSATQTCRVTLARSDYSEVRAIEHLRISAPDSLATADDVLLTDPQRYLLEGAVPSSLAINVVVVNEVGELLCCRRSAAVDNARGLWTVGVFETLKQEDPNNPGRREDFFALADRALEEELGLRREDVGDIHVSWFGLYRPILRGHLVAVTRYRGSSDQLETSARASESSYEHDAFDWMPLTRRLAQDFVRAPRRDVEGTAGRVLTYDGRKWLEQSALSVSEALRFTSVLDGW